MAVAFGMDLKKDAALNYNVIPPEGNFEESRGLISRRTLSNK